MKAVLLGIALTVIVSAPAWVWNPYHLHTLIMAGIFAVLLLRPSGLVARAERIG